MLELPSREVLTAVTRSIDSIVPTTIVGLARAIDEALVQMLFWHAWGLGSYIVPIATVPGAWRPATEGVASVSAVHANPESPIEWRAAFAGAARVLSVPVPHLAPVTRLWIGLG